MSDWKLLKKEMVFEEPHNKLERWTLQTPKGKEISPVLSLYPDAVFIFGITSDQKVLILKQFVVSALEKHYALVAGRMDEGETPEETARRELKEETGYSAKEFIHLGSALRSKWGTGTFHFLLATNVVRESLQKLDDAEDIEVLFFTIEECLHLLRTSQIHDVPAVACVYRALDYLGKLK